jgi:nitric oxide reductase NorQ protein
MSNAANRQRGVEHDIVQRPQASDAAPYYEPQGNEVAVFEAAARRKLPVMLNRSRRSRPEIWTPPSPS